MCLIKGFVTQLLRLICILVDEVNERDVAKRSRSREYNWICQKILKIVASSHALRYS